MTIIEWICADYRRHVALAGGGGQAEVPFPSAAPPSWISVRMVQKDGYQYPNYSVEVGPPVRAAAAAAAAGGNGEGLI